MNQTYSKFRRVLNTWFEIPGARKAQRALTHYKAVLFVCLGIAVASFIIDWFTPTKCAKHLFSRSGAVITVGGLLASTRRLLRLDVIGVLFDDHRPPSTEANSERDLQRAAEAANDQFAARLGFVAIFVGTFVWAYGDLLL